ncbi:glycoside hydrolase family 26 protein [Planobispora longispora]|uniref:GH26 domain-containing protein n=1 Tax=Planobispora longispora TaxID=28887 RepID=A0A8J3RK77_9ACTN|nr:hypothetical protein [Planobispora longispora]GIH77227.1 hypothetical protein Plo01_36560 [Planobispora longispora]
MLGLSACNQASGVAETAREGHGRDGGLLAQGPRSPMPGCEVSAKLIPSCGAWWGMAPEIFTGRRPAQALRRAERRMGRTADIMHVYHRGSELFPTGEERSIARDPAGRRLLLINWKPSLDHTWAEVARGAVDRRIDRLARHITRTFPERFFLTVHHEPEDDVRAAAGSGMTARDYAAMYRHVILRLREKGVKNAVAVMTYMGAPNWAAEPWFEQLYPGDDVVDWVAMDPYADDRVQTFDGLINKTRDDFARWPGFYRWMQWRFPGKPIMLAEWGVFERPGQPRFKESFFASVRQEMRRYPQLKALVYFDSPRAPRGDTRFDSTPGGRQAFAVLARDPYLSSTPVPDK